MSTRKCFGRGDPGRRRVPARLGACRPELPAMPDRNAGTALPVISPEELRALLDDARSEVLLRDDHPFRIYLHYESRASALRQFAPLLVPQLLRTERYRDAILPEMRDDEPAVYERDPVGAVRPAMSFLLDEAVVRRTVGDADVMREQLVTLDGYARGTGLSIRVVPFSSGTYRHMGESFTLLDFADPTLPPMVYVHGLDGCFITAEPRLVASYSRAFDSLELIAAPLSDLASVHADTFRVTEAG